MAKDILSVAAMLVAAFVISGAILLRPTGFDRCIAIISADIYSSNQTATLDPRDVEAQAARTCSGNEAK